METHAENVCQQDEMRQKLEELVERIQTIEDGISKKRRSANPRKNTRTICDDEHLREMKLEIEKCSAAIQSVLDGGFTLTAACAECRIDYRMFRNLVSICHKSQLSSGKYPKPIDIDEPAFSTWDERLYSDILGIPLCSKELTEAMPQDAEETLSYILETYLTPREQQVIKELYEEGKTQESVGSALGVTKQRVSQIQAKVLRKIRYRIRHELPHGLEAVKRATVLWEHQKADAIAKLVEQRKVLDEDYSRATKDVLVRTGRIPLEDVGFSARAYNVLRFNGVETLADVLSIQTQDELLRFKNCGKRTVDEIVGMVHSFGYAMAWER